MSKIKGVTLDPGQVEPSLRDDELEKTKHTIKNLVAFQLGELPDGDLALLLEYAMSQGKLSRPELKSFLIGMSREEAIELATVLLEQARRPLSGKLPTTRQ